MIEELIFPTDVYTNGYSNLIAKNYEIQDSVRNSFSSELEGVWQISSFTHHPALLKACPLLRLSRPTPVFVRFMRVSVIVCPLLFLALSCTLCCSCGRASEGVSASFIQEHFLMTAKELRNLWLEFLTFTR
jgi:hypothetical protein